MSKRKVLAHLNKKTPGGRSLINKAAVAELLGIPRQNLTAGLQDGSLSDKHIPQLEKILKKINYV